ncbi:retron St85 family RNA-directed DNA polymerase [Bacillus solimangrovi]|uniref:RNA-directed DNA polymerase n=1 Tax=Bacillus solimangrovi TaxID=1305675 RepID=A0A1E5LEQ8_9BACI|nr:retron St85 family RNA-directed DNA polymerase [Bacillus solimangrovi]OEH92565.1 hypothetical protein BFG57_15245 [Bacillus solimangrovi]
MSNIASRFLNLPTINNLKDLSLLMNLSEHFLNQLSRNVDYQYKEVKIKKKDGSKRLLACPTQRLKAVQAWILRNILEKLSCDSSATAYIKGYNLKNNAQMHTGSSFFLCLDIKDFFGTIPQKHVYQLFRALGYNEHVSIILSNFCCYKGVLPQGGVTSPILSNLINIRLDRRIQGYVSKRNITYTRYADDITLSANNPDKLIKVKGFVEKIIKNEGYILNENKARFLRPGNLVKITGLVISTDGSISIGRKKKRLLRAKIHKLYFDTNLSKLEKDKLSLHINGWFSFLRSIDPDGLNQLKLYTKKLKQKKIKQKKYKISQKMNKQKEHQLSIF